MDLEQTVKDLQAQNAQFQQMFLTLAKGQEELKTVVPENFPSHISQNIARKISKLLKVVQGLARQALS